MTNADIGITVSLDTDGIRKGVEESKRALGGLADFTKGALTAGLAVGVAGVAALGAGLGLSVKAAMEAQQAEAQLDAVLKSTGEASKKRMEEYVAAQGKVVTVNVLSKKEQEKLTKENQKATEAYNKLGDKLKTATAKLQDMEKRMKSTKEPTASATLALERQRKTVADLEMAIAKGAPTLQEFATKSMTLAESLGLTPPVAQMTKEELLKLASSLQSVTTVGDEAILGAESMILTFTNIGKEIFPQVTETVLDMATAMNGGATPSAEQLRAQAIQLGKALNNPKEGLTALTRVGVTFTEAQKEQIKAMVDAGDTMGAQKIILAELAGEFGGSARAAAETFGGKMEQITNIIGDLQEIIGGALIPILTTGADKLKAFLTDETVQNFAKQIGNFFSALFAGEDDLNTYWEIFESVFGKEAADVLTALVGKGFEFAGEVKKFLDNAKKEIEKFWMDSQPHLDNFVKWLTTEAPQAIEKFWTDSKPHLDNFVKWLTTEAPQALQTWYSKMDEFEGIKNNFIALIEEMTRDIQSSFQGMNTDSERQWAELFDTVDLAIHRLLRRAESGIEIIRNVWKAGSSLIQGDWGGFWDAILAANESAWLDQINFTRISHNDLRALWQQYLSDVTTDLRVSWENNIAFLQTIPEKFRAAGAAMIQSLTDGLWSNASAVTDALASIIQQAIDAALSIFGGGGGGNFAGESFGGGGARPMLPPGNSMNFGGITINFNGENAPRTQAEADQSASLFIDALRSKGYAV